MAKANESFCPAVKNITTGTWANPFIVDNPTSGDDGLVAEGTWRMQALSNGNLDFQRRESGVWVSKQQITA